MSFVIGQDLYGRAVRTHGKPSLPAFWIQTGRLFCFCITVHQVENGTVPPGPKTIALPARIEKTAGETKYSWISRLIGIRFTEITPNGLARYMMPYVRPFSVRLVRDEVGAPPISVEREWYCTPWRGPHTFSIHLEVGGPVPVVRHGILGPDVRRQAELRTVSLCIVLPFTACLELRLSLAVGWSLVTRMVMVARRWPLNCRDESLVGAQLLCCSRTLGLQLIRLLLVRLPVRLLRLGDECQALHLLADTLVMQYLRPVDYTLVRVLGLELAHPTRLRKLNDHGDFYDLRLLEFRWLL